MFKITSRVIWRSAIESWRRGDAAPLLKMFARLQTDDGRPIPDFALAFLQDLAGGKAKRRNGRPSGGLKGIVRDHAIRDRHQMLMAYAKAAQGTGLRGEAGAKDVALDQLQREFHLGKETLSGIVYPRKVKKCD